MKYILILLTVLIGGLSTSCQDQINDKAESNNTQNATFEIGISDTFFENKWKPGGEANNQESTIKEVDLLFFKGNDNNATLLDHQIYIDNSGSNSKQTSLSFTRTMPKEATMVMAIANAHQQVSDVVTQNPTTYGDLVSKLTISKNTAWDLTTDFIPMWARITGITVEEGMKPLHLRLLRMLAKINVSIADGNKFTLKHVFIYNGQDGGRIVPDVNATDTLLTPAGNPLTDKLSYDADAATNDCKDKIYVFEANTNTEPGKTPYLVIGGSYNQGGESFYRLDLADKNNTDLPLKRNNRYNVAVSTISKQGRSSADEAGKHPEDQKSVDYNITVGPDTEDKIRVTATDGQYILGLSTDVLTLAADSFTFTDMCMANRVWIQSNTPNTWTIDKITDADGTENPEWIQCDTKKGNGNNITQVRFAVKTNDTGADRIAMAWVKAGSISYGLKIQQSALHQTGLVLQEQDPETKNWKTLEGGEIYRFTQNCDIFTPPPPSMLGEDKKNQIITLRAIWYPNNVPCLISHESQLVAFQFGGKNTDKIEFAHLDTMEQSPTANGMYEFNVSCDTVFNIDALKLHPYTSFINFTAHNEATGEEQSHGVFFIQENVDQKLWNGNFLEQKRKYQTQPR